MRHAGRIPGATLSTVTLATPLNTDISIVVQGPVQNYQGRTQAEGSTRRCLDSIRKHLPGSTIILSTWENQDLAGLDFDVLLESPDPGGNTDGFCPANYDRQIVSTRAGLRQVTTRYAMKMRGDNYLTGDQFKELQQQFTACNDSDRYFNERVVVNSNLFRRYSKSREVALMPSDFFYYGTTDDLLRIWDQPLFAEQPFAQELVDRGKQFAHLSPLEAEQVYCTIWLHRLTDRAPLMAHRFDNTAGDLEFWHRFVASNLVVAEPALIGLGLREISIRNRTRPNEMRHFDWGTLYRRYCDPSYRPGWSRERLTIQLKRSLVYPLGRLKHRHK